MLTKSYFTRCFYFTSTLLLTSSLRDAFTPQRNVLLAIFRSPEVPMLSRSFLNAFTDDFVRFEAQWREKTANF